MSGAPGEVGIVGLGLVGGSLARALAAAPRPPRVTAVEPSAATRALAEADGAAQVLLAAPGPELAACDVVVLCAPLAAIEALLAPVSAAMRDGALLLDVAGVKRPVVAAARSRVRAGVRFVGAHPMFGGAGGGYAAARPEAWRGGTVAVTVDGATGTDVGEAADFFGALGAEVVLCSAEEHDVAAAAVSHLPYLVASALALAARDAGPLAHKLAGPGLASMTRLAGFAFDVQGEVARRNAALPAAAQAFGRRLDELVAALAASPEAARAALEAARAAKEALS